MNGEPEVLYHYLLPIAAIVIMKIELILMAANECSSIIITNFSLEFWK